MEKAPAYEPSETTQYDTISPTCTPLLHLQHLLEASTLPTWATPHAAGLDLHSAVDMEIGPGQLVTVPTDIAIKPPPGTYGQILSQSGLITKHNIEVKAGTIDADYTGNVMVLLYKNSIVPFQVNQGNRIA